MMSPSTIRVFDKSVSFEDLRNRIRELAYHKWQQAGCIVGEDKRFWKEAENEFIGEDNVRNGGYYVYVKHKHNSIQLIFLSPIYNSYNPQ